MKRNIIYLESGSIVNNIHNTLIQKPAILLDKDTGCVHAWGNRDDVMAKFQTAASAYIQAGLSDMADALLVIDMTESNLSVEEQCYLLKRCVEHTASGFQTELCRHATQNDGWDWLHQAMQSVPIDLSANN